MTPQEHFIELVKVCEKLKVTAHGETNASRAVARAARVIWAADALMNSLDAEPGWIDPHVKRAMEDLRAQYFGDGKPLANTK